MQPNASFRSVPFWTRSYDAPIGRRVVIQEYPLRDLPTAQDLGRATREFSIDAYVLGDDYDRQRNALQQAIETPGAGELIHPKLGRRMVVLTDGSLSERNDEQRMARFSLKFTELGNGVGLIAKPNAAKRVEQSALELWIAAKMSMLKKWQIPGASILNQSRQQVEGWLNHLETASRLVRSKSLPLTSWTRTLADARAQTLDLLRVPGDLSAELKGLSVSLRAAVLPVDLPALYQRLYQSSSSQIQAGKGDTPRQTLTLQNNQKTLIAHEQAGVIAEWGTVLLTQPTVREEALRSLDSWLAAVHELRASEPELYPALTAYQSAVLPAVHARIMQLPPLERVSVRQPMPLLAVAYAHQGPSFNDADWLAANAATIRHPLRLLSGEYWGAPGK